MHQHTLSRPGDYSDPSHRRYAGTPLEIAGKELQRLAHYPHPGWGFYAQDFERALELYIAAGGTLPSPPRTKVSTT